ncbi:mannose-1-phosphate guanylyltransferase/mannose-6-phosphate isomerase [Rhodovibrio salinarum]|uniref:mannose-1-phosphate guanylyltransferase n=1 Tax=Rhodovibrio salinarum TaxID=1087 RepID=A0A934V1X5_9PROT|nr:mannose-1-phosphate guanylyltransferase/mannose-6-phosphate isomerase [Rhodovibrio salinarum]MBK1699043.1 mannose-1-phosphate guanylyltransferase/mannose-6-phosphate isomerase [Rhodovibrio salinarum]
MRTSSPTIHPVILSGGSGTRLWPVSRHLYPKQLLPLIGDNSMLADTALRVGESTRFAAPTVICNEEHRFLVAEELRKVQAHTGTPPGSIILEPFGRNTAPAAAVAALQLAERDPNALLLLLPSDHVIADTQAFLRAIDRAANAAANGWLVTFGMTPTRPETGYGYIRQGTALDAGDGCYQVAEFVEKPDQATAARYLADGGYAWNSGMFLLPVRTLLSELERLQPDALTAARSAVAHAQEDLDFLRLDAGSFEAAPSISIDHAVMEHTDRAAVVPAEIGWSDVGSWASLWEIADKDADGNAISGDVVTQDARNCLLRSEQHLLAAIGVEDLVVIAQDDAVLVVPRDRAQDVGAFAKTLRAEQRSEADVHSRVYRPWGSYQGVDLGPRFQVKRLTVSPGSRLSLQSHKHRAEHWVVVEGVAEVTCDDAVFQLYPDQSTYIPLGAVHRLANPGDQPLHVIEVQSGDYLGEDDIERYEDIYGRS